MVELVSNHPAIRFFAMLSFPLIRCAVEPGKSGPGKKSQFHSSLDPP
jgi:hypothetical protein